MSSQACTGEWPGRTGPGRQGDEGNTAPEGAAGAGGRRTATPGPRQRQTLRCKAPPAPGRRGTTGRSGLEVGAKALQEPDSSAPELPVSTTPQTPPCPKGCVARSHSPRRNHRWAAGRGAGGRGRALPQSCVAGRWGPGGTRREPSFVRDAPGSHAPGVRASSRGPGVGPRPPRLAELAARDWRRPRPPPLSRGGPGARQRRAARAASGGLARLRVAAPAPGPRPSLRGARCACRRPEPPGTSGLRVGVGVPEGRGPAGCPREAGVAPGTC